MSKFHNLKEKDGFKKKDIHDNKVFLITNIKFKLI